MRLFSLMDYDRPSYPAPSPYDEGAAPSQSGFDYREFLHLLKEKSWIVVLGVALGALTGGVVIYRTAKVYQSRIVLEVDSQMERIAPVEEVRSMNLQSLEQLRTIEQNLHTRSLLLRVARATDLVHNSEFLPRSEDGKPYNEETIVNVLSNEVNPVVRRGTRLIDVFVTHTDPKIAQMIADSVGTEYIRQSIEKRGGNARFAYDFLLEESEKLKKKVTNSEDALQAYREANGSVSFDERENITEAKLKELNSRVTQAKADRLRLEGDFGEINKFKVDPDKLMTIPSIANHPTVLEIKNQISNVNAGIAALSQRYKDKHPKMIQARSQLAELNRSMKEAVLRLPPLLQSVYQNSIDSEKNLGEALAEQQKVALQLNKQTIPYNELRRQVDVDKTLYESVLKRLNETDLTKGLQADPVQIQEAASYSPMPVGASPSKVMAMAVLGGLMSGLGIVALLNFLDRTIKTVDQAEYHSGLPVIGSVPEMQMTAEQGYRLMLEDPSSIAAEAFRTLRASLDLMGPEDSRRVVLFTSPIPSEGKSFTCTNYAVALAQQGKRTLLIDADLRRPTLHKIFAIGPKQLGVTDYLAENADLMTGSVATEVENLRVMPGGHRAPNPAELLAGDRFFKLIGAAALEFDRVVVDTAPVIAVSDTLLMAAHLKMINLVVRAKKTPRNAVKRAIALLEQAGSRPVGLVLNRLPRKSGSGYYYYYSEHGYGEGAYGSETAIAKAKKA